MFQRSPRSYICLPIMFCGMESNHEEVPEKINMDTRELNPDHSSYETIQLNTRAFFFHAGLSVV